MTKKPSNPELRNDERDNLGIPDTLKRVTTPTPKTNGGIAPVTVGDPDNIDDLAIDQEHLDDLANPTTDSAVVECRRPSKGIFFTCSTQKEDRGYYRILEIEGRDPLLVAPKIAEIKRETEDVLRPVLLVRFVTMSGDEGLWPLKLNPPDGRSNAYNTSALRILEDAEKGWVRIVSVKKNYRSQPSKKTLVDTPPRWSKRSFKEMVAMAFPEDRTVRTLDHEIWDILDNGSEK
jgi:hypothetical protein